MSGIHETETWFVGMGLVPDDPEPDYKRAARQVGMQLEQLSQKIGLINPGLGLWLHQHAIAYRGGECDRLMQRTMEDPALRAIMLQNDVHLIWETVGAARALGAHIGDAYKAEVNSRWALEHPDGQFKLDNKDEPIEPPGWKRPEYKDYLP